MLVEMVSQQSLSAEHKKHAPAEEFVQFLINDNYFCCCFCSWLEFHFPSPKCQNLPHGNIHKQKEEKCQSKMFPEGGAIFFNAGLDGNHIIRNIFNR
jgi:hypothetical protein